MFHLPLLSYFHRQIQDIQSCGSVKQAAYLACGKPQKDVYSTCQHSHSGTPWLSEVTMTFKLSLNYCIIVASILAVVYNISTWKYLGILDSHDKRKLSNGQLWKIWKETALLELCSFFIDILAFELGKLCSEVGILFRFFDTGAEVLH